MPRRGSVPLFIFALLFFDAVLLRPPAAGTPIQSDDAKTETSSATAHPVLIELFTSEGCSSCPPADALVQKLDAHQPIPGVQLIVLSEHVDYWDHDGWKDPNSSAALTERQSAYVRALGLSTPYTPQLIVDGTIEVHANEAQRLEQVLRNAATAPRVGVRIGAVSVDSGDSPVIRAHVDTDTNLEKHNADVFVAVALDHVESQVLHGENGGRRLTHVAVVQQLTRIGKLQKGKTFAEDVQLKLKPGTDPRNVRLVVFVQESGPGRLLGAALRKATS
jgi:hypothetical protein